MKIEPDRLIWVSEMESLDIEIMPDGLSILVGHEMQGSVNILFATHEVRALAEALLRFADTGRMDP